MNRSKTCRKVLRRHQKREAKLSREKAKRNLLTAWSVSGIQAE